MIGTTDPAVSAPNNVELYYTLTIPPGSYDGDSLASRIKNLVPNHSTDSSNYAAFFPYEFDVSFSDLPLNLLSLESVLVMLEIVTLRF